MPCDLINTCTVNLETCDRASLLKALKELGYDPQVIGRYIQFTTKEGETATIGDGSLKIRGAYADRSSTEALAGEIRNATQKQILKTTAAKYDWTVKVTGPNKYKLVKRVK